VHPNETIAQN